MHVLGEALNKGLCISREVSTVEDLSLELGKLRCSGELTSEKEPEGSLGKRL